VILGLAPQSYVDEIRDGIAATWETPEEFGMFAEWTWAMWLAESCF